MNVRQAITIADELRPNVLSEEQKYRWVFECEGRIAKSVGLDAPENTFPDDYELMVERPYEMVYVYYLIAMIDYFNQEFALYNIDLQIFETMNQDAMGAWRREHPSSETKRIKVM